MPDRVYDLWYSYYQLEPFGNELERMAEQVAASTVAAMIQSSEAKKSIDTIKNAIMPGEWVGQPEIKETSIDEVESTLAAKFG